MASFVETATLRIQDQSTKPLNAINKALRELQKTAQQLRSKKIDLSVTAKGLTKASGDIRKLTADAKALKAVRANLNVGSNQLSRASRDVKRLTAEMSKLRSARANLAVSTGALAKAAADVRRLTADLQHLRSAHVNLNVNTRGLTAAGQQIRTLRSQAAQPITLRTVAGGVAGHIAAGAATFGAGAVVSRAVKEGATSVSVGETSLALKQLNADQRANADRMIAEIGKTQADRLGGAMWHVGQIMGQFSEMFGVVKVGAARTPAESLQRMTQAKFMADQNLELARTLVTFGMSADEANEESIRYGKALEIQGKIYDKQTGVLDVAAATKEYDQIRQLMPVIGKEMTGTNFLQLVKYLRSSKFALSPSAMALAMGSFEEMGTNAAVGLNQMIKTTGQAAKEWALDEQARLGLIGTKQVLKGKVGKQKMTTVTGVLSEADSRLLRENPQEWVDTKLVPALKRDLMQRQKLTEEQAEAKLNDPAWVSAQMNKTWSDRTAQEMATSMVLRRKENKQFLLDWASRSGSLDVQRAATATSVVGAVTGLSNQFEGLLGTAVQSIAPMLTTGMGMAGEFLRTMPDNLAKARTGDLDAITTLAKGALAGTAATAGASAIAGMISKPLGLASGLLGLMNPATRPLAAAGLSLQAAADDLSAAAGLQSKGLIGMLTRLGVPIAAATAAVAGVLAQGGDTPGGYKEEDEATRLKMRELSWTDTEIANTRTAIENLNRALAAETPAMKKRRLIAGVTDADIQARRDSLISQLIELQARRDQQAAAITTPSAVKIDATEPLRVAPVDIKTMPPLPEQRPLRRGERAPRSLFQPKDRAKPFTSAMPPWWREGPPRVDPSTVPPGTPVPSFDVGSFATSTSGFASAIGKMAASASTFETVFAAAPGQVATAGSTAAQTIQDDAASAGAAYGNAAVARIAAATSNITVNVNTTVNQKPDTGSQSFHGEGR